MSDRKYIVSNGCYEAFGDRGETFTVDWDGFVYIDDSVASVSIQLNDEQLKGLRKYIVEQFEEELE